MKSAIRKCGAPGKVYPNTVQKLAENFYYVQEEENVLEFADELGTMPDLAAVCVTDEEQRPLGIIRRDQLFMILGKRFGRDIMARRSVKEICEGAPQFPGDANVFTLAQRFTLEAKDALSMTT